MNKFVTGALALAATGSAVWADPRDSNEWLELDSEINGLASSYTSAQDGMGWTALVRFTYTFSSDDIATGAGGDDISGFSFEDVDTAFWGGVGDYTWRVSFDIGDVVDIGSSTAPRDFELEDAYVTWECGEYFTTTAGQYKARVFLSNIVDPENQLFIDRSALGSAFDWWDPGVAAHGSYEQMVDWYAHVQNGGDGDESGHRYSLRGEYHFGTGAGPYEGAMDANDELNGSFGAVYFKDETISTEDTELWGFDARGTMGPFGLAGEVAFVEEALNSGLALDSDYSRVQPAALPGAFMEGHDTTPWGVTLSYLLNEEFEGGVRYDFLDNDDDTDVFSVVVNWYQSGHNAKWQAQWTEVDSDSDDGSIFQLGVVVGSSR